MDTVVNFRFPAASSFPVLLLAMNFNLVLTTGSNIMRCYCNLPECMNNACKSRAGCFQELPHFNMPQPPYAPPGQRGSTDAPNLNTAALVELRYGCLELWPSDSAPFQCTEPGIRKSPVVNTSGGRRLAAGLNDYDMDDIEHAVRVSRVKNPDRLAIGRRRASANRRHSQYKTLDAFRWSSFDVPLRCCNGDMCNRRGGSSSASKFLNYLAQESITANMESTSSHSPDSPSANDAIASHWWFTSTMIFVPIIGGITFVLLVAVGCWILHFDGDSPCQRRSGKEYLTKSQSSPTYYFHETTGAIATAKLNSSHSMGEHASCKCIVVETEAEVAHCGRCVHVPIFLSGDYVVNVKTAGSRTLR